MRPCWIGDDGTVTDRIARQVVVRGLVQGVFFRDSCRRQALDVGVGGWVSNEPDGTVRAMFEGSADAVEGLVAWMYDGPPNAVVEGVDVTEAEPTGLSRFEVR
jgi:acylphosphatase